MQRPCGGNECGIFKELNLKKPVFLDFRGMGGREKEREQDKSRGNREGKPLFLMK